MQSIYIYMSHEAQRCVLSPFQHIPTLIPPILVLVLAITEPQNSGPVAHIGKRRIQAYLDLTAASAGCHFNGN